jgi:hypothetical protein
MSLQPEEADVVQRRERGRDPRDPVEDMRDDTRQHERGGDAEREPLERVDHLPSATSAGPGPAQRAIAQARRRTSTLCGRAGASNRLRFFEDRVCVINCN